MDAAAAELVRWLGPLSFVALSAAFALGEWQWPRRPIRQFRDGVALDVIGLVISAVVGGAAASATYALLARWSPPAWPGALAHPAARAALFFVTTDLARFATHVAMHQPALWRFHHFHHSPRALYWLSGNRGAPAHVVLLVAPTAALTWALRPSVAVIAVNLVIMAFWSHFMHTNLRLGDRVQRWLEWLVTTPRYHHLHHAKDPALYGKNLASIFTIWDRLARTYVDPDRITADGLAFGVDSPGGRTRMVIGI